MPKTAEKLVLIASESVEVITRSIQRIRFSPDGRVVVTDCDGLDTEYVDARVCVVVEDRWGNPALQCAPDDPVMEIQREEK